MRKVFIDCGANKGFAIDGFRDLYDDGHEIFAFECLPECIDHLKNKFGDSITVIEKAVYTEEGKLCFNTGTTTRSGTIRDDKRTYMTGDSIEVDSIDLSAWILENFSADDHITICMDIEGAEYAIIPKLISSGAIDFIDKMYVEWHSGKLNDMDALTDVKLENQLHDRLGKNLVAKISHDWDISHS